MPGRCGIPYGCGYMCMLGCHGIGCMPYCSTAPYSAAGGGRPGVYPPGGPEE